MKKKEFNYRINSNENPISDYQQKKSKLLKRLIDLNLSNSQISNLVLSRGDLTRILYYNQIYQNILGKPGSIMEFGVQYGLSLSLLLKLRSIYEPFNYSREIIGFDTFEGFTKNLSSYESKK